MTKCGVLQIHGDETHLKINDSINDYEYHDYEAIFKGLIRTINKLDINQVFKPRHDFSMKLTEYKYFNQVSIYRRI